MLAGSARSTRWAVAPSSAAATAWAPTSLTSQTATRAPSTVRSRQMAEPMPPAPAGHHRSAALASESQPTSPGQQIRRRQTSWLR